MAFGLFLAAGLFAIAGCKREQPLPHAVGDNYGVQADVAKLEAEFANRAPELQSHVALLKHAFRYSQFPQAIVELEYLANSPDLTPNQKKLVEDLIERTKQVAH